MEAPKNLVTLDFLGLSNKRADNGQALDNCDVHIPPSPCVTLPLVGDKDIYGVPGSVFFSSINNNAALRNLLLTGMISQPRNQNLSPDAAFANIPSKFEQPVMPPLGCSPATGIENTLLAKANNEQSFLGSRLFWFALDSLQSGMQPMEKKGGAELTIFYNGSVHVYNDISIDQLSAIMDFASNGNLSQKSCFNESTKMHNLDKAVRAAKNSQHASEKVKFLNSPILLPDCQLMVPTALPLARKASLARFLEKRRERVQMKAPYSINPPLSAERFSSSNCARSLCEDSVSIKVPVPFGLVDLAGYLPKCDINRSLEESCGDTAGIKMPQKYGV